jgi:hypothetical protein
MLLRCPACSAEVFKANQRTPLLCPNCGASARPSWWRISAILLLMLVLGAGLYFSIGTHTWWPVLAGLILFASGYYPLRFIPLVRMRPWEMAVHRTTHFAIVAFLAALILFAAFLLFGPALVQ